MKYLVFLSIISTFLFSCNDDDKLNSSTDFQGDLVWSKSLGGSGEEKANSIVATPDDGFIVVGYTDSNDFDIIKIHDLKDIWVSRYDKEGQVIWSKTIGGSLDDFGYSIIASNDGNYVIAGYSGSSDGDVPSNLGLHDFYVTKINGEGSIIWKKSYGFSSHDHAHKIIQTSDDGYFVAGFADYSGIDGSGGTGNNGAGHEMRGGNSNTTLHGVGEYLGIKLDTNGNFEWYRYFGGTMNDRVNDIVETNDGGIIMVGFSESNDFDFNGNKGSYDYWVVNLHQNGDLHWKKNYGGSDIDQAFGIVKTDNNSYLIAGRSNSLDGDIKNPKGNFDAWVIHINLHGDMLWEKSFGGTEFDVASSIKKIKNGHFVVVGNSRSSIDNQTNKGENDFWAFEIDNKPNSNLYWQKSFGGSKIDIANDFIQTTQNELIIIGESQSSDFDVPSNKGNTDLFMIKLK